jgi:membrane protease YdiL (CAAX protease family)
VQPPSMSPPEPQRLTLPWLIVLHLGPGIGFTALLIWVSQVFVQHGLSAYLAEVLLVPVSLAPMLAGIVLLWNARQGEVVSLVRPLTYREHGSVRDYVLWPTLLYSMWAGGSFVTVPLADALQELCLGWFPQQLTTEAMFAGLEATPPGLKMPTLIAAVLCSGLVAPLVEEAYFRGFLLPRMRHLGLAAPALSAFLFGLYHFFSPWSLPVIFLAFLPVAYVVQATGNYRIAVVVHAMLNLTGVLTVARSLA